jgi:anti-anti-sigma factor
VTDELDVHVSRAADHIVVAPRGRIYFDNHQPLRDELLAEASAPGPRIVLDLGGVDLCDSSGLNLMVQAHLAAARNDGWLRLASVQPIVRQVLEATNLTRMLSLFDTVEQATAGG